MKIKQLKPPPSFFQKLHHLGVDAEVDWIQGIDLKGKTLGHLGARVAMAAGRWPFSGDQIMGSGVGIETV